MKKFGNIKYFNDFQIKTDSIIIPLHSPDDSPEELIVNDSDPNITRAVVHVSYEPKELEAEKELSKTQSHNVVINQCQTSNKSDDKIIIVENTYKNPRIFKDNIKNSIENNFKVSNNLIKFEETSKLSKLNR